MRRRALEQFLLRAERTIALVERCRPLNADAEQRRLAAAWQAKREIAPVWIHGERPDLSALRTALASVVEGAATSGWDQLYADRARELDVEAALVSHVGDPRLGELASQRFSEGDPSERDGARNWAESWSRLVPPELEEIEIASDDPKDPRSLLCCMQRAVGERRLPFRVVVRPLLSAAATGDGVIVVREGASYSARDVRRIVVHEVEGHAMPRARARTEALGLFVLGTRGGSDDEEGRALLLEERAGCLDDLRHVELGRRHLAALAVRDGADWVETVRKLVALGAPLGSALTIASRVHRGGGLAREIVYLPALCRVREGCERDPGAEAWLERGRIALSSVSVLRELGEPPDSIGTPRAA
jgi:hypothetical protein